jgi:hypothetical protein
MILQADKTCYLEPPWPLKCGRQSGDTQITEPHRELSLGKGNRRQKRIKMVLPVRISGKDSANNPVNELAHTLDITPNGARLGAIRHLLKRGDKLTLQYRQRRIQFKVAWVKAMEGSREYQVGLEGLGTGENWGLELPDSNLADEYQVSASTATRSS